MGAAPGAGGRFRPFLFTYEPGRPPGGPGCGRTVLREDLMTTETRPKCETCGKLMSMAQAVVALVAGATFIFCLDCAVSQLTDDDSVSISVDLLRRLKDGIL